MQRAGVWSVPVVVKFTDDDDTYEVSATSCRPNLTIVELRKRIADRLRIPCSVVQILQHGNDTHRLSLLSLVTFNAMRSPDRDHSVKLRYLFKTAQNSNRNSCVVLIRFTCFLFMYGEN